MSSMEVPDVVYTDTLSVLHKVLDALERKKTTYLQALSNQTIHNASIFQDEFSINVAIVTYSLYQLQEAQLVKQRKDMDLLKYTIFIEHLIHHLEKRDVAGFDNAIKKIFHELKRDEEQFGNFISHVKTHARLNKSAKLMDHGISIGQAAQATGVSQWQVYKYIGQMKINDDGSDSVANMRKRLQYALRLFDHEH